jgi:hypothetical protein
MKIGRGWTCGAEVNKLNISPLIPSERGTVTLKMVNNDFWHVAAADQRDSSFSCSREVEQASCGWEGGREGGERNAAGARGRLVVVREEAQAQAARTLPNDGCKPKRCNFLRESELFRRISSLLQVISTSMGGHDQ